MKEQDRESNTTAYKIANYGFKSLTDTEKLDFGLREILKVWFWGMSLPNNMDKANLKIERVGRGYMVDVNMVADNKQIHHTVFVSNEVIKRLIDCSTCKQINNITDGMVDEQRKNNRLWYSVVSAWNNHKAIPGKTTSMITYKRYFTTIDAPIRILK